MRNTIAAAVFCLFIVLPGASLLAADETQEDEKITMPKESLTPPFPGGISPPGGIPSSGGSPVPMPVTPGTSGTGTVIQASPDSGATTVTKPSSKTPVQALPERGVMPEPPQDPNGPPVQTPPPQQKTTPHEEGIAPDPDLEPKPPVLDEPSKQLSRIDFLPGTSLDPGKTQAGSKAEKNKQPDKVRPEKPKTQPTLTKEPPRTAEQIKPKSGAPLHIPPDAAKTGDLSFLEGCWHGGCPYDATFTQRFCFDKNGSGKRTIDDQSRYGKCAGAAKGSFDAQGRLIITNERAPCTKRGFYCSDVTTCEKKDNATSCLSRSTEPGCTYRCAGGKSYLVRE